MTAPLRSRRPATGPTRSRRAPRRPGTRRSAGDVLVIGVAALVLAALINADAMVQRAEEKPFGAGRDRSLAIWHPVQDISHVLQLHRLRDLGDALAGNEDGDDAVDAAAGLGATTIPEVAAIVRPALRPPTAADPLRVLMAGDSVLRDFSESVLRLTADDPRLAITPHYEIATGLTRPDAYNWPAALVDDVAATDPELVIVMFGGNDGQGIIEPDGTVHQRVSDPGWAPEYARRVGALMDQLRGDGDTLVYWVLQPPMRDADFDARIDIIDGVYEAEAEDRPWVEIVDTTPLFGTPSGEYADNLPGVDGTVTDLRQGDGIHLSRDGADLLATYVLDLLFSEISLPAAVPSTTTTATSAPPG